MTGWRARSLGWLCLATWLGLIGFLYAHLPVNPDLAIFDYIGWQITEGASPYTEVAEQNFPGKMWLHAAAGILFGNEVWSYRLFDYLLLLAFCWIFQFYLRDAGVSSTWAVLAIYPAIYATSGYWAAGCRDAVAANLLLLSLLCYTLGIRGKSIALTGAGGIVACAATLCRPTYAVIALLLLAVESIAVLTRKRPARQVLGDFAGFAIGFWGLLAATGFVGWQTGQLQSFYELAIQFNLEVYSNSAGLPQILAAFWSIARHWLPMAGIAALGAVLLLRRERGRNSVASYFLVAMTCVVSAVIQGKGFAYHFAGLFTVLAMLVSYAFGCGIDAFRNGSKQGRALATCLAIAISAVLIAKIRSQLGSQLRWVVGASPRSELLAERNYLDTVLAARHIADATQPHETILVWSRHVHVNFLAKRASPSRFITVWALDLVPDDWALGQAWILEFEASFLKHRPSFVVLDSGEVAPEQRDKHRSESRAFDFVWEQIDRHYELDLEQGGLTIFKLHE
jgi:hypothetical protein